MSEHVTEFQIDGRRIAIPADATASETAAIAAALGAHIRDQQAAAVATREEDDDEDRWEGKRFAFAGRLEGLGIGTRRVPRGVPTDNWTAASRTDRY